jgi:hypothetical protein
MVDVEYILTMVVCTIAILGGIATCTNDMNGKKRILFIQGILIIFMVVYSIITFLSEGIN